MVGVDGYASLLTTAYGLLAVVAKTPELALKDDETAMYARALVDAQKHFPIPVLDPKWVAVGGLLSVAFVIHRRMFVEIQERKARETSGKRADEPVIVGTNAGTVADPAPWFNLGGGVAPSVN